MVSCVAALAGPRLARAQEGPAGSVHGSFLATPEGDFGAGATIDVWWPIGILRLGGLIGAGAIPSEADARNRVFMPLCASVALEIVGGDVGVSLRARGGMWGGATQEVKLTAGGLIGGGAFFLVNLGGGATLDVGLDAWGFFGAGSQLVLAPSIGLSWGPAPPSDEDASDDTSEASDDTSEGRAVERSDGPSNDLSDDESEANEANEAQGDEGS